MSHTNVIIAHKDKDYGPLLERHYESWNGDGLGGEYPDCPFGYDYLARISDTTKVCEVKDIPFGDVIQEDEVLFDTADYGWSKEDMEKKWEDYKTAISKLNPDYWVTIFDGHL